MRLYHRAGNAGGERKVELRATLNDGVLFLLMLLSLMLLSLSLKFMMLTLHNAGGEREAKLETTLNDRV